MFTSVKAFDGQQYSTLKRQCLQSGLLFEDPRFPAIDDSLFYLGNRIGRVVWKRPRVSSFKTWRHVHVFKWLVLPHVAHNTWLCSSGSYNDSTGLKRKLQNLFPILIPFVINANNQQPHSWMVHTNILACIWESIFSDVLQKPIWCNPTHSLSYRAQRRSNYLWNLDGQENRSQIKGAISSDF